MYARNDHDVFFSSNQRCKLAILPVDDLLCHAPDFLDVSNVKVGIALSPVQEANMMDLLHRMGAISEGGEHCQWIDASVALAAISLAGEKAGGRFFQDKVPEKSASFVLYIRFFGF